MPRRSPPRIAAPVVVLAIVMIGIGVWTAVNGGDDGPDRPDARAPLERRDSERRAGGAPLTIDEGPGAYTVTYALRQPGLPDTVETIAVVRPYRSRRTAPTETTATDFSRLQVTPSKGAVSVLSPPPAAVDPRPALVLDRAVEEGLLERREQREVIGRRCQVHRGLGSVSSSTISAALPREYTDVCIAGDGLVLEEWQVLAGRPVRQRIATSVKTRAEVAAITAEPTLTAKQGGGSVLEVEVASEPVGRFFVLDDAPAGFTLRGRYSVIPPQPGLADEAERRKAVASTADVYERGDDILVVDRGATLNQDTAFQMRPEGREIDLGPVLGPGEMLLSWTGPEVRVALADGKFVRVYGTVGVDEIVATARALGETPGGTGLVFLPR